MSIALKRWETTTLSVNFRKLFLPIFHCVFAPLRQPMNAYMRKVLITRLHVAGVN